MVTDTGEGILIKPAISTADLAGSGSKHASSEEMKILLDKLRDEGL